MGMTTPPRPSTIDRAIGRWKEILPRLGLSPSFLTGKHGPCPFCQGKDRFRFDDKEGSGSYICGQCGAGYGIDLAQKVLRCDFKTACREVDSIIGNLPAKAQKKATDERSESKARWMLEQALKRANDRSIVASYLADRGLSVSSMVLHGDPACPYYIERNNEPFLVGRWPAILAPILSLSGDLLSIQRVYLGDVPEARKKNARPIGTIAGGAVRLQPAAEEMGVCEGWETGLACHQIFKLPIWAGLTEGGLNTIELPPYVRKLHVFGDNDLNFVGQAAAFARAKRAAKDKLEVKVHMPAKPGSDWLNVLNEGER